MDRRTFVGTLTLGLFAAPLAVGAQQAAAIPRIGFLSMGSAPAGLTFAFEAFRKGLRDLGWTENENIAIEYRWAGESPDRLFELATDLVRLKVDIIIGSTPGVRAAQHATTSIPIIMCIADDAVKEGFVPNLARPGGNIPQGVREWPAITKATGGRDDLPLAAGAGRSGDRVMAESTEATEWHRIIRASVRECLETWQLQSKAGAVTVEALEAILSRSMVLPSVRWRTSQPELVMALLPSLVRTMLAAFVEMMEEERAPTARLDLA